MDKTDKKKKAILEYLQVENRPLSSTEITRALLCADIGISERAVRMCLQELDKAGFTKSVGRQGRVITNVGQEHLYDLQTLQRVGYMSSKIDQMIYRMSFDLAKRTGKVIVNVSLVDPHTLADCIKEICAVFSCGYSMGSLVCVLGPGERAGDVSIPYDKVGLCTVCTITLNGVLLKNGIPMNSRFAGLLRFENHLPVRFTEIIHYNGISLDPLELFIRAGLTDFRGAVRYGNGVVGAGFREVPSESRSEVKQIGDQMKAIGLGSFVQVGYPNQSLLGIPVYEGRIGVVTIGGLNPVAVLAEKGYRVFSRALSGLMDYEKLYDFKLLPEKIKAFL